ncbi:MAG: hypothetical protein ACFE8A_08950 [Candidatus Hodarchaeota archaeon]
MIDLIIAIFQILLGFGFIGFWIVFYFTEYKNPKMDELAFKHEKSFPLPDLGWIMPCLFISAIGILMEQKFGYFFSALAGSGMMFLGLIDLAFDIQNGVFKKKELGTYIGIIIILLMLIFGPIFIIYAWFNL